MSGISIALPIWSSVYIVLKLFEESKFIGASINLVICNFNYPEIGGFFKSINFSFNVNWSIDSTILLCIGSVPFEA